MSAFASDWLALREPADHRARDAGLLEAVVEYLARVRRENPAAADAGPTITDLACGTGSTLRALAPRLPRAQRWRLVDNDTALLQRAASTCMTAGAGSYGDNAQATAASPAIDVARPGALEIEPLCADLAVEIESIIALHADLITTSAFLDLVSQAWLERWVGALQRHRRPVYAALTYDGRVDCSPRDPLDTAVFAAFDAHQRRDKGLGGALGPAAAAVAVHLLRQAGFEVQAVRADWRLSGEERALQHRLLAGWREAVAETGQLDAGELDGWQARRGAAIEAGTSLIAVGHLDLFALPSGATSSTSHSMSASRR